MLNQIDNCKILTFFSLLLIFLLWTADLSKHFSLRFTLIWIVLASKFMDYSLFCIIEWFFAEFAELLLVLSRDCWLGLITTLLKWQWHHHKLLRLARHLLSIILHVFNIFDRLRRLWNSWRAAWTPRFQMVCNCLFTFENEIWCTAEMIFLLSCFYMVDIAILICIP